MKQTATNQFNDGLNMDLHPIVTPNSVLTDNLNGTFITYNGNEFCLQNDKGNTIKGFLTEGFVPIGIKEHNGILYIVSYNAITEESEIGTFPGLDWSTKKEKWVEFEKPRYYAPIKNLIKNPVYATKKVHLTKAYATTGLDFNDTPANRKAMDLMFDNFITKLQTIGLMTDEQVANFLANPVISSDLPDAAEVFLKTVLNGNACKSKYGASPIYKLSEDSENIYLFLWSGFLGDNTDIYDFDNYYGTYIEPALGVIQNNSQYEQEKATLEKYAFAYKDYYKTFSYDGYEASNDYNEDEEIDPDAVKNFITALQSLLMPGNKFASCCYDGVDEVIMPQVIWEETEFEPLRTKKFNFDAQHPVEIEIQDSYDGSVNLILSDNKNAPRIVNTEFSVSGDKYKIIQRNIKDYLVEDLFDTHTNLIKNPISFAKFDLVDIYSGGQLKGGNYTFYAKLGDADGNQTDIVAESGTVSVFKGTVGVPKTISGTLADERTDKIISLKLSNINEGYSKVYLYYTRDYSDTQGYWMQEAGMIEKPYDIIIDSGSYVCNMLITGFENTNAISVEDLNIDYHTNDRCATMTQQQDMLFLGNVGNVTYDYSQFDKLAKKIKTSISNVREDDGKPDTLISIDSAYDSDGEYYNIQNIYSKVGYWPGEYYRFGIVFILEDGHCSQVFNMNGGDVEFGNAKSEFTGETKNIYGVFHTPKETDDTRIIDSTNICPWHFRFDCTEMIKSIGEGEDNNGNKLVDIIKGYFIVRQKRIPEVIAQGIQVKLDETAHVPVLPWRKNDTNDYYIESFLNDERLLTYAAQTISGARIKPTESETVAYKIKLKTYGEPNNATKWISGFLLLPTPWFWLTALVPYIVNNREDYIYAIVTYDADGKIRDIDRDFRLAESNINNYPEVDGGEYWFNYNKYHNGYAVSYTDNPWITTKPSSGPGGNKKSNFYYTSDSNWIKLKEQVLSNKDLYIGALGKIKFATRLYNEGDDPSESHSNLEDHFVPARSIDNCSAVLSLEATLCPSIKNRLSGNSVKYEKLQNASSKTINGYAIAGRQQYLQTYNFDSTDGYSTQAVYVNSNNSGKVIGSKVFATVIGNAYDITNFVNVDPSIERERALVRGRFTPFIGLTDSFNVDDVMDVPLVQLSNRINEDAAMKVRSQDNSPYYTVSDRYSITNEPIINAYRGDCFVVTETIRMNYNFIDPTYPYTENIVDKECWRKNYRWDEDKEPDEYGDQYNFEKDINWDKINTTDVNTVSLGHWITFKCLASSNLGLRSEDPFDTTSTNIMGNPRSFYPLSASTATANKQQDSELFNAGYGITTGSVRRQQYIEVPYVKQEYENRIMFSNKHVTDQFVNGYRIFQGLSYQDYDKQYGPIVKIESWGNNILCVFEHGIAMLPVNEKALMQTTTEQTIHIYGHGVLPEQMSIISQDYGSRYANSVIRTPIGIYGIDTDARKIWRFSDKQGFETLSDMKIESYLNQNLVSLYDINIPFTDIRSHYNSTKGDIIFTWYRPGTKDQSKQYCSICFNERQGLWITRYDWLPIVSENVNGEFFSLQYGTDKNVVDDKVVESVGIYSHDVTESAPTKWYGMQKPFEFEFVVSDPIGVHKIYENLQIISNNVQPEELQFEFIGDSYMFNKERIYHSTKLGTFDYDRVLKANYNTVSTTEDPNITDETSDMFRLPSKTGVTRQQDENNYKPFRNASILKDRNMVPNFGRIEKTKNATNQYHLIIPQECRNVESWGRRLGNIHYKADSWYATIEPILYDARLNDPQWTKFKEEATKWSSARIRDKWCNIRVRYSGEDLAVITAIKTMLNI